MKRYLLFCFDYYYPCGGWHDFVADGDTVEELVNIAISQTEEYYHVVDTQTLSVVATNEPHR